MRTYNIPIFVPHKGCPFDCVFCNQKRITGEIRDVTPDGVREIISRNLITLPKTDRYIEAAFFGGSFTGIPIDEQSALLSAAHEFFKRGEIDGIRLSTRPDYISEEILDNLQKYGVTTIELGVQSMNDEVLRASNRGHTRADVVKAAELIKRYPFTLGLQMMTGLPLDTFERSVETAREIIALKPAIVRIYPTLTIKDTYLEKLYLSGKYRPQTVDEAVELCKQLLIMFEENGIKVIRIGLQATDEISETGSVVAGPVHSAFRELVESAVYYDKIEKLIKNCAKKCEKGAKKCEKSAKNDTKNAIIAVDPREISKAVGNRRSNIIKIKSEKNIDLKVTGDASLSKGEVKLVCF